MPTKTLDHPSLCRLGLVGLLVGLLAGSPAVAFVVFDPTNFQQNVLTATHTLTMLQQQVTMIQHQVKDLTALPTFVAGDILADVARLQALLHQAAGLTTSLPALERQFQDLYRDAATAPRDSASIAAQSQAMAEHTRTSLREAMQAQSLVNALGEDLQRLQHSLGASQGAVGQLQALQAANELSGMAVQQQLRLQHLLSASTRAMSAFLIQLTASDHAARAQATRFMQGFGARTR